MSALRLVCGKHLHTLRADWARACFQAIMNNASFVDVEDRLARTDANCEWQRTWILVVKKIT